MPEILISSRQRRVAYDQARLLKIVETALPLCRQVAKKHGGPLLHLKRIECAVLGRRVMARVHREFLAISGPTDVITFPYGEILVCASVASSQAGEFGSDVTTELALYCIHGLLHLAGLDDREPNSAKRMTREQEKILRQAVTGIP